MERNRNMTRTLLTIRAAFANSQISSTYFGRILDDLRKIGLRIGCFAASPFYNKNSEIPKGRSAPLKSSSAVHRSGVRIPMTAFLFLSVAGLSIASAQTATINWTNVHQEIDGFGAADAGNSASMTSAQQAFFFGLGAGQLGLSLLRAGVSDGSLE